MVPILSCTLARPGSRRSRAPARSAAAEGGDFLLDQEAHAGLRLADRRRGVLRWLEPKASLTNIVAGGELLRESAHYRLVLGLLAL